MENVHMKKLLVVLTALLLLSPGLARAEEFWTFSLGTGTAYNFPSHLHIEQKGEKDINMTARYKTHAWDTQAWYYDIKIAKWKDGKAWEIETLHHKLYLDNKPHEVQRFAISHGYNINTINRAWLINGFIYRVGLGFVVTHPETEVRHREYDDMGGWNGFHLSGVAGQLGMEKRFYTSGHLFYSLEAKFTAGYARIPVADGHADVPNYAIHGILSIGYKY
jgi:hypothetical protein